MSYILNVKYTILLFHGLEVNDNAFFKSFKLDIVLEINLYKH